MELTLDVEKFEQYEEILIKEIIQQVRLKLVEAGLTGENLRDATGNIVFSFASTLDDNAAIEIDGVEVKPFLMFANDDGTLLHCGENSNSHEFVADIMDEVFND